MGGGTEKKDEEKKEEEKFVLCESIGHRPLWGRCPKRTDRQTNGRTDRQIDRCLNNHPNILQDIDPFETSLRPV